VGRPMDDPRARGSRGRLIAIGVPWRS
jgi:hypothetical protein